jgi:hypothetical protein
MIKKPRGHFSDFYDIQGQLYEGREAFRMVAKELQSHSRSTGVLLEEE